MPKYNFSCQDCLNNQQDQLTISEYQSLKDINYFCNSCGSKNLVKVFKTAYSNIDRNTEDIMAEIKDEVRATIEKVNSGDISSISDIYGEEVNKLKTKG
jgi:DNA-directed RNA polymerase subunit RPC12/RpoP